MIEALVIFLVILKLLSDRGAKISAREQVDKIRKQEKEQKAKEQQPDERHKYF